MEYLCPDTDNQLESGVGPDPKRREREAWKRFFNLNY